MTEYNWPETPGALLGWTKNGRPIHLLAGGSSEDDQDGANTGTEPADPGNGSTAGDGQNDGNGDTYDAPGSGSAGTGNAGGTGADNSAAAAGNSADRAIAAIRQDFKDERRRRQEAEKKFADMQAALDADKAERKKRDDALAVALGLKSGEEPPDPAKLAQELQATRAEHQAEITRRDAALQAKTVELAALTAAARLSADGSALLDSRSFVSAIGNLNPADADFGEDLDTAIKKAVEANPRYKLTSSRSAAASNSNGGNGASAATIARSGAEHTAPGGNRQWNLEDVDRASGQEVRDAQDAGLLVDLGFGPPKKRR